MRIANPTCLCSSISLPGQLPYLLPPPHYCVTHFSFCLKWVHKSERSVFVRGDHSLTCSVLQSWHSEFLELALLSPQSPRILSSLINFMSQTTALRCLPMISLGLGSDQHVALLADVYNVTPVVQNNIHALSRCGFFVVDPLPNVVTASSPFSVICNNTAHTRTDTHINTHAHTHADGCQPQPQEE